MNNVKICGRWAVWLCGVMAISLVSVADVQAQTVGGDIPDSVGESRQGADEWTYTIGAGPAYAPDYEGSNDYDVLPLPIARAGKGPLYVRLFGGKLSSNFINHESWRLGPVVNFRRKRGDVDSNRVQNMETVDAAAEVGAKAGYDAVLPGGILSFEVEFLHDITDNHDGWTAGPRVTFKRMWEDWNFALQAGADYASDNFMSTYFGVSTKDAARSGFKKYGADAGVKDFQFAASVGYRLTESWGIGAVGQWKRLLGDADDGSPVVDAGSEDQAIASVFVTYTFGQ
jgi:outer membrane protein